MPPDGGASQAMDCALRTENVWKRYSGTVALRGVSIQVRRGKIHALLGGNGSGKSTLIKVISGVEEADDGVIELNGTSVAAGHLTPTVSFRNGVRVVHQHPSTFPELSVAENLAAGASFSGASPVRIRWREVRTRAAELLERFHIDARPSQSLASLRPATQRMIEIARALQDQDDLSGGVLILDEPTAKLPIHDVRLLKDALRRYAQEGQTIMYVTHLLEELEGFADSATVLRDGVVAGTLDREEITPPRLLELMVGGVMSREHASEHHDLGPVRLRTNAVRGGPVRDVSLQVHVGETVGLAGLGGSGRSSLLQMIFGVEVPEAGEILVDETPIRKGRVPSHWSVAYVPEDRLQDAAFEILPLSDNLVAASVGSHWRGLHVSRRSERRATADAIKSFNIKAPSVDAPFATLSGGNQQKAILARWFERSPGLLLLDEPTQGVDVASRAEIHGLIRTAVEGGAAAVVASSDYEELCSLCDRVIVLGQGAVRGEVAGQDLTPENLERLAYGGSLT
jgi:ribose transport system ATP-binding protein